MTGFVSSRVLCMCGAVFFKFELFRMFSFGGIWGCASEWLLGFVAWTFAGYCGANRTIGRGCVLEGGEGLEILGIGINLLVHLL